MRPFALTFFRVWGRVIPICAVALSFPAAARGDLDVRLAPESASLFIHEPFTLRLEIVCDLPPDPPSVPAVPGLAVVTVRRLPPDAARRIHAFQIELIAERDGVLLIPPFAVRVDGERAMTPALRLLVRAPRPAKEMALAITVEPAELRVGQPATVTVTWTSEVPFSRCQQLLLEIPLLTDERCQPFPLDHPGPEAERIGLPVNRLRVVGQSGALPGGRHVLSFRYKLIPRVPCVLRTPSARLVCALLDDQRAAGEEPGYFYNHFFSAPAANEACERIYLIAPVPEIHVRALPELDRTSRFAEIVGPCALRATVAPERLMVGQPALLTVHLDGLAFARQITGLPAAALSGLRPEFQLSADPIRETAADHSRSFTFILRPLRAGIARIPAVVLQTFDPESDRYQTLRSAPVPVTVEPDPETGSRAVVARMDARAPVHLNGIRHNRAQEPAMMFFGNLLEFLGRLWWVLLPLPPLAWLALRPVARRWERCRRDPAYARADAAWRRFRKTVERDEEIAWRTYLADRLGLCAEALTAETVAEALRDRKVEPGLVAETRRRFEERDAADYGRRPATPFSSTRSLVRRLHQATVPLLLVWSLFVPLRGDAAGSPEDAFARAMQMRTEKPDEAQPIFSEAALGFESAGRFLNAGNAWFFAGERGRALANYRAAQRRWPFDRQLRETIEFLRAGRADAFPLPAGPGAWVGAGWAQFSTWAAVLRAGLLVLTYLAVSMLFLAAQLLGWRLRRAVWGGLTGIALLPLVSLVQTSFQAAEGVVIEDTVARLGPGYAYDAAFREPLHMAAEFTWLETRHGWVRARLPGAAEGWLRESDCVKVR